jgi:hypothetical protein
MTRQLRCPAGHVVATRQGQPQDGILAIRTNGRRIVCYGVIIIECACGACWRPDAPRLPLDDLEYKAPTLAGRR